MNEDNVNVYKILISPKDGEVALAFGQPVMGFDSVDQFEDWLTDMLNEVPDLRMAMLGEKPAIPKDYVMDIMKEFQQALLTDTLKEIKDNENSITGSYLSRKMRGPKNRLRL